MLVPKEFTISSSVCANTLFVRVQIESDTGEGLPSSPSRHPEAPLYSVSLLSAVITISCFLFHKFI